MSTLARTVTTIETTIKSGSKAKLKATLQRLLEAFLALEREQRDLDFRRAEWARDARSAHNSDDAFRAWCREALELREAQIADLLFMGRAARVIADADTWRRVGGLSQIRAVQLLTSERDQVSILEAAKANRGAIRTLVREHIAKTTPAKKPGASTLIPVVLTGPDAAALLNYLRSLRRAPLEIKAIADRIANQQNKV